MACFPLSSLGKEESNVFRVGGVRKGETLVKQTVPFHSSEQKRKHCIGDPERRGKQFGHGRKMAALLLCTTAEVLPALYLGNMKVTGETTNQLCPQPWVVSKGIPEVILPSE